MTDIIDVKKKVREVLLADSQVAALAEDRVYIGWYERNFALPCITVFDVSETGEVGMLGGTQDQYNGTVQVDVWSGKSPLERDQLAKAVKAALGNKTNFQDMQASGFILGSPTVRTLDELDIKPPLYRKRLSFPVMYFTGSYV